LTGYFRHQQIQLAKLSGSNLLSDRSAASQPASQQFRSTPAEQATMERDIDVQDQYKLRRLSAQDAVYTHKHQEVGARVAH
jgi:hypothetical protein